MDKNKNINIKNILYNAVSNNKGISMSMTTLLIAYFLQDVVFFGTFSKFTSDVPKFVDNLSVKSVMAIIFPYIIAELLFYINNIIVSHSIPQIELEVVEEITKKTLESIKTSNTTINTNEYIMNLKKVMESKSVYYLFVSNVVPTILVMLGMIYYFMSSNTKIGMIVVLLMILFMYTAINICMSSVFASYANEDAINMYYDNIQDVMGNSDVVVTSNCIEKEVNNLGTDKTKVYNTYLDSETISSEGSLNLRLLSIGMATILDALAIYMYMNKTMNIELVTSICITSVIFLKYFNSLVSRFRNTVGYIGKFYEIDDYFASFKIGDTTKLTKQLDITYGDIDMKNINLTLGNKKVLDNFNFKIKGGTKVGIIGDMGSGKTSLLKIILGLLPYTGTITIDEQNLKQCDYGSIMKHIVYIPQHPKMFNKDVYYNISYGTNKTESEVNDFLKQLNFFEFFNEFPNKLKTSVGKEGKNLSGGQKQLIAIIRSLLQNKSILLLDEPTSSLDVQTKEIIVNLIKQIKGKTILVVTHDQTLLPIFDDFIIVK